MKLNIIKALLPYIASILVVVVITAHYFNMKHSIDSLTWNLEKVTLQAEVAQEHLQKELEWREKDLAWKREWSKTVAQMKREVDERISTLREISYERESSGVNNSLSVPVTRVLKQYTEGN